MIFLLTITNRFDYHRLVKHRNSNGIQGNVVMKIQHSKLKNNGISVLSLIILCGHTVSSYSNLDVVFFKRPLSILVVPFQKGTANLNFSINLKSYISKISPEINYRLTVNPDLSLMPNIAALPRGVTRVHVDKESCPVASAPVANQKCNLRFVVNKKLYTPYHPIAPLLSLGCHKFTPGIGQLFSDLIPQIPGSTVVQVRPYENDGLVYNPSTMSITGKPQHTGPYIFRIKAVNGVEKAASRELRIDIGANIKDTPVFKSNPKVSQATPNEEYRIDLMDLVEPKKSFMITNQVHFRIEKLQNSPNWLKIESGVLSGLVPFGLAGTTQEIKLIAASNTGGDSKPFTLKIPVGFDSRKKPVLDKDIIIQAQSGVSFQHDLGLNIHNPAGDKNITLQIVEVKPSAPWLSVSQSTELTGRIPPEDAGKEYQIILYAKTPTGGESNREIVTLMVY